MKINQKIISLIGVSIIIILFVAKLDLVKHYPAPDYFEGALWVKETKLDSLNKEYRETKDKLERLKQDKEIYTDGFSSFSGWTFGPIGIGNLYNYKTKSSDQASYLKLTYFGLKINEVIGKSYFRYQVKDGNNYITTLKFAKNKEGNTASYEDKKVAYKYSSAQNNIFLKIGSNFWKTSYMVIGFIVFLLTLALLLFILFTFFNFLLSVAKNKAFDEANIQRLRDISIGLFILSISAYITNGIIYLLFISKYPADGVILTYSFWEYDYYGMIFSILSYLLYTSFKHAMVLQSENDLTI
jgi:hypothetical protein